MLLTKMTVTMTTTTAETIVFKVKCDTILFFNSFFFFSLIPNGSKRYFSVLFFVGSSNYSKSLDLWFEDLYFLIFILYCLEFYECMGARMIMYVYNLPVVFGGCVSLFIYNVVKFHLSLKFFLHLQMIKLFRFF